MAMSSYSDWISTAAVRDLLALYASIEDELRRRKITKTANNPVGDYARYLFNKTFGWTLEPNSNAGFSAVDDKGVRYKISSRRTGGDNEPRQLGALRNLNEKPFTFLAGVIFRKNFSVLRAAIVPYDIVLRRSRYSDHVNAWLFHLEDDVWSAPGVRDVTGALATASDQLAEGSTP
jgi:hypothetical protein